MAAYEKVAAVVTLYNPDSSVVEHISSYAPYVDRLYIVDNSENIHDVLSHLTQQLPHTVLLHQGANIGMAKALNTALYRAREDGYEWLITFDQDTFFDASDIPLFLSTLFSADTTHVAIVSPLHNKKFICPNAVPPLIPAESVMTSANAVHIQKALSVGGFNEKLFIDEVDHDFCFRLAQHRYKILLHRSVAVNHTLGTKKNAVTLYPPERLYYMLRNYLYLRKHYRTAHQDFFQKRDRYLLKFFTNQLLYGESKIQNMKMMFQGIMDYRHHTFGKKEDAS